MEKLTKKKVTLGGVFPWVWLLAAYCALVGIQWVYGRTYLDSDIASEMVLANLLNREGGILSTNWYYSTEIRVFCEQLLYMLGLRLFPTNWHLAHTVAQALLAAILAGSSLYFFYGARLRTSGVYITAALLCPFGFWYLFHGVFGGFYFVHIILLLLSMGLVLRLAQPAKPARTALRAVALGGVCLAAGLNGIRMLMCLYLPLVLAAFIVLALRLHEAPLGKKALQMPELRLPAASLYAAAFSAAGYLVNSKILEVNHHFTAQENRQWAPLQINALLDVWGQFLAQFGYPVDGLMGGNIPLFSLEGVLGAFGLLLALGVLFCIVRLVLRWRRLDFTQRTVVSLLCSALLVMGVAFVFTESKQSVNGSYWLPIVPLGFAALGIEAKTEHFRLPGLRRVLAALFTVAILCCSTATTLHFLRETPRANPAVLPVCDWLQENGYTQGYATFWNANVLTELSDGKIEMWDVSQLDTLQTHYWLQETSHCLPPEGRVFVLAKNAENAWEDLPYAAADGSDIVYQDESYTVLSYDDAGIPLSMIPAAEAE